MNYDLIHGTVTTNSKLKPCSCGGEVKIVHAGSGITERCYAFCLGCSSQTSEWYSHEDEEEVITAWNNGKRK